MAEKKEIPTVAIQGFAGSFHHAAVNQYFGSSAKISACQTFSELIRKTENDEHIDYGLMAIENSIAGSILPNYQLMRASSLSISGEVYLKIGQQFLALKGQNIADIKEVHSHHMALKQCEKFLSQYPHIKIIESEDTALSAQKIAYNKLVGVAAIASSQAAKLYDLEIMAHNIETVSNNFTRFLILTKQPTAAMVTSNKATLLFSLVHEKGSLAKVINCVADHEINISKIQSFPIIEEEWTYYFCLDLEYDYEKNFGTLCQSLDSITSEMRILGTYQKGKTV